MIYLHICVVVINAKQSRYTIISNKNVASTNDDNVNIMIKSTYLEQVAHLGVVIYKNMNMHCKGTTRVI